MSPGIPNVSSCSPRLFMPSEPTHCEVAGCPNDGSAYLSVCVKGEHAVVLPKLTTRELRSFVRNGSAGVEVPPGSVEPRVVFLCDNHAGRHAFVLRDPPYEWKHRRMPRGAS